MSQQKHHVLAYSLNVSYTAMKGFIHTSWKSHEECLISAWKGSCDVFAFAEIQVKGMDGSSKEWGCLNTDKMRIWRISEVGKCFKVSSEDLEPSNSFDYSGLNDYYRSKVWGFFFLFLLIMIILS